MNIYIDIETAPTADESVIAELRANVQPPGNYKKPESIAAWMETEGEAAALRAISATALQAELGEIIAIGLARDEGEPVVLWRDAGQGEDHLLRTFFGVVSEWLAGECVIDAGGATLWHSAPFFIAHNAQFDLGWLWRRCIVQGLRPPFPLPAPGARQGRDYGDTMAAWAGPRDRVSLRALCRALGLPDPKAEGDGTMAHQWWSAGDFVKLARYTAGDVEAVRAIWQRMVPMLNWRDAS